MPGGGSDSPATGWHRAPEVRGAEAGSSGTAATRTPVEPRGRPAAGEFFATDNRAGTDPDDGADGHHIADVIRKQYDQEAVLTSAACRALRPTPTRGRSRPGVCAARLRDVLLARRPRGPRAPRRRLRHPGRPADPDHPARRAAPGPPPHGRPRGRPGHRDGALRRRGVRPVNPPRARSDPERHGGDLRERTLPGTPAPAVRRSRAAERRDCGLRWRRRPSAVSGPGGRPGGCGHVPLLDSRARGAGPAAGATGATGMGAPGRRGAPRGRGSPGGGTVDAMCGRYASSRAPEDLAGLFEARWDPRETLAPSWNVAPTDQVWAVLERADRGTGRSSAACAPCAGASSRPGPRTRTGALG